MNKKMSKIVAISCGVGIITANLIPVYADNNTSSINKVDNSILSDSNKRTSEKEILTAREAVSAALKNSEKLKMKSEEIKMLKEKLEVQDEFDSFTGSDNSFPYDQIGLLKNQSEQAKGFMEDQIANDITNKFNDLVSRENELDKIKNKLEIKTKEIKDMKLKKDLGLVTSLETESAELELQTLQNTQKAKLQELKNNQDYFKLLTNIDLNNYELIDIKDLSEASLKAVELVSSKKADIVMKGLVDTSIVLKAVLNKEIGLRTGNVLSHTGVFAVEGYNRLFFITDAAMNIDPDLNTKKQIIENAVRLARALDIEEPKVAVLCAKEKVNPKMPDTVDAKELEEMYKRGEIKNCIVGGPFALDNAVSEEAAKHKGIDHPVAGKADVLLVPDIEAGNIFYKSMTFFAKAESAGLVLGAKAPIVLTSRADSDVTKLNSIALGVLAASKND